MSLKKYYLLVCYILSYLLNGKDGINAGVREKQDDANNRHSW